MIKSTLGAATLAALVVFGASEATADWELNPHNVTTTVEINNRASLLAVTDVCTDPKLLIATEHFKGDVGDSLDFKMRIDTQAIRSFTGAYDTTGISWLGIYIDIDPVMLKELTAGHAARFQWMTQGGSNDVHTFSLMGFTRTVTQARNACDSDQRYFNSTEEQI